jgi:hypothetical protein
MVLELFFLLRIFRKYAKFSFLIPSFEEEREYLCFMYLRVIHCNI